MANILESLRSKDIDTAFPSLGRIIRTIVFSRTLIRDCPRMHGDCGRASTRHEVVVANESSVVSAIVALPGIDLFLGSAILDGHSGWVDLL
jgi:hypothetical protein